jgi:hypothetical protein
MTTPNGVMGHMTATSQAAATAVGAGLSKGDGVWPPDAVRNMGIYLVASKGSGKSRALGRWLAKQDLLRGIPQVILDPVGGTIDNLLDVIIRLPAAQQAQIWPRIVYVDMGAEDYVVPFPLYYRLRERDSLYQIAQRYLDVLRLMDPHLQSAAVEGWNALWQAGTYSGMALAAVGGQVVDAPSLLVEPKKWKACLKAALARYPEAQPAVSWLMQELSGLKSELRSRRTASFLQKVAVLNLEDAAKAMFGADRPGLDWQQVLARGQTVLLDLRHVLDAEQRRFRMLWALFYFIEFIKARGAGRHRPVGLIIDEISALTNFDLQSGLDLFAVALDELLNIWARQGQIWVTASHQEVWQVSPRMLKTLMGCGTRILGRTSDMEAALTLAQALIPADPHRVKRYEPIYGADAEVIDQRPVTYSLDEQHYLAASLYKNLGKFRFVVKSLTEEGGSDTNLRPLSLANVEPGVWPDEERVAKARAALRKKSGTPVDQLVSAIEARRARLLAVGSEETGPSNATPSATIETYDSDGYLRDA